MKKKIRHILSSFLVFCMLFSFSSCIDDDWFDDDWWEDGGWHDDRRAESVIRGRWYVVDASRNSPYYISDEFNFYGNGKFEILGDGDLYESGVWWVDDRYLLLDFGADGNVDFEGFIDRLYRGHMSLDVADYDYHADYYIDLGK